MRKLNKEWILFGLIFLVGAFLRLYRIEDTLMFQGDQGRDALVVKRMLFDHDLTLIGPVTSVGNMYLGPFYYYYMALFLSLSYPNPVGPAVGVAILDLITLWLVYFIGRKIFSADVGLVAMLFYAVLNVAVTHARFSWNPNIAPFFGLVTFYYAYEYMKTGIGKYFWGAMIAFSVLIQLHYVALLAGILPAMAYVKVFIQQKQHLMIQLQNLLVGIAILMASTLPLMVFNMRHNNLILNGFVSFFGQENKISLTQTRSRNINIISRSQQIVGMMVNSTDKKLVIIVSALMTLSVGGIVYGWIKNKQVTLATMVLFIWIGVSMVGTTIYSESIYKHYLSFLYTGLAFILAIMVVNMQRYHMSIKLVAKMFVCGFVVLNLWNTPILRNGGHPAYFYAAAVKQILAHMTVAKYNIALIADNRDYKGMNYRYFFETSDNPPQKEEDYLDLDYLVVIDEKQTEDPGQYPVFEIQTTTAKKLIFTDNIIPGLDYYIYEAI